MKIDENYTINCDGSGCSLNFQEDRQRNNKTTGEKEVYTFKDQWHYLSVPQCLSKYKDLSLVHCKDLKEVMNKLDEVAESIRNIK